MITRETDYGIRLVLALSVAHESGELLSTAVVAERMDIPYRYLRVLSRRLVASGLLESKRGRCGGMRLKRPPDEISLLDVVQVLDPRAAVLNSCLLDRDVCSRSGICQVHAALAGIQGVMEKALGEVTFSDLTKSSCIERRRLI